MWQIFMPHPVSDKFSCKHVTCMRFLLQWDMVCGDAYLKATGDALFMLGVMLGSIGFGELSDRYYSENISINKITLFYF